ncbi:hypothetical protein [Paenibacillus sp. FSL K6-1318]|uniref:hypothetical protein n=1 Tax=Paenibacillus sp. FSL K6-1318 TaxID=2975291 RepID=UPI0030EB8BC0
MKDNIKKYFKENTLKVLTTLILVLLIFPFLFKLSQGTEGGFWGSYLGGILSGLGTLFAVYITTIETRKIQKETRENLENEKMIRLQYQRKIFTNEVEKLIAEYITDSTEYYFANRYYPMVKAELDRLQQDIDKKDKEINEKPELIELLKNEKETLLFRYKQKKDEQSLWTHKRTIAIQNFNLLKIKLYGIREASELIGQVNKVHNTSSQETEYVEDFTKETEELMRTLALFSEKHVKT